jgi:hypothetical protein
VDTKPFLSFGEIARLDIYSDLEVIDSLIDPNQSFVSVEIPKGDNGLGRRSVRRQCFGRFGIFAFNPLLGFENKTILSIEVNSTGTVCPIPVVELDRLFKDVSGRMLWTQPTRSAGDTRNAGDPTNTVRTNCGSFLTRRRKDAKDKFVRLLPSRLRAFA